MLTQINLPFFSNRGWLSDREGMLLEDSVPRVLNVYFFTDFISGRQNRGPPKMSSF